MQRKTSKGIRNIRSTGDNGPAVFVCCECNELLDLNHLQKPAYKRCKYGHPLNVVRPAVVTFLQGLGWGVSLMVAGFLISLLDRDGHFAVLAVTGAMCSALACKRMLDGLTYMKLSGPAKGLGRQYLSEAVGAWLAVLLSTLFRSQ